MTISLAPRLAFASVTHLKPHGCASAAFPPMITTRSVFLMSVQLGLPVGSVLLGTLADSTGTRTVSFLAGAVLFVYLGFISVRYRGFGLLDPDHEVAPVH